MLSPMAVDTSKAGEKYNDWSIRELIPKYEANGGSMPCKPAQRIVGKIPLKRSLLLEILEAFIAFAGEEPVNEGNEQGNDDENPF